MHCGRPTGYFTYMKNTIWIWHYCYFKYKNCFHSNSHRLQLPRNQQCFPWNAALCPIAADFQNSKHQLRSDRDLDLSTSHDVSRLVTIRFALAISYRSFIGTDTLLSPKDFEIVRLKCIWVTVLTFLGHVTSSVTWPFDCPLATSYRCSNGTDTLSPRDFEILRLKYIWVTLLAFPSHVTSSVT